MDYRISTFSTHKIYSPSVLIVEPNPYHGIILPGFTKYFQTLGYKVDIFLRSENYTAIPFVRYEKNNLPSLFHGSAAEIKSVLQSEKIKEYDFVLISSNAYWEPGIYQNSYIRYLNFIPEPKYGTLFVEHNLSHIKDDDSELFYENQRLLTLYHFAYQNETTTMINPHYIGKFKPYTKSETINFITVGSISKESKNHELLIDAANKLLKKRVNNFTITLVGDGTLNIPKHLEKYIKYLGVLNFPDMLREIERADFYLPLLDPILTSHRKYLAGTTTGSLLLMLGSTKIPVMNKEFAKFYGFNKDNSIMYENNELVSGMHRAIQLSENNYKLFQSNLKIYAKRIETESLQNLKNTLETLKKTDHSIVKKINQDQLFLAKKRLLNDLNKTRLEIKQLRRQLGVDDDSIFFKIKQYVSNFKKDTNSNSIGVETDNQLMELNKLTSYRNKLVKLRKILFFMPWFVYVSDRLYYSIKTMHSFGIRKQLIGSNKTLVIFGAIPYTYRYQRPQHLAYELCKKGWKALYIELIRSSFSSLLINKIQNSIFNVLISTTDNPNPTMQLPTDKNKKEIVSFIKKLQLAKKTKFKLDHPFWSFITEHFANPIIYDCMDDHESFEASNDEFVTLEKDLVKKSSAVIASSNALLEKMKKYSAKKTILIKNAGDYKHFATTINGHRPSTNDKQIIGYYGAIAEWFDEKIIIELAKQLPEVSIMLIGQVSHPTLVQAVSQYKNITLLGEKPYKVLPNYLHMFNVCLIPFIINDLTRATNPVKIYEYFAAGKPVVSTNLPELQEYKNIMYLAQSIQEFVEKVKKALNEKNKDLIKQRQEIAKNNTWEKRGEELNKLFNSLTYSAQ